MESNNQVYDYIIIGGGITGLYASLILSKKHNILLLDDRKYWGGRIITNKKPQYEIGAARYNNNHVSLTKLIKKYDLTPIKISSDVDYLDGNNGKIYKNIDKVLNTTFKNLIQKSKEFSEKELQSMTLYEYICIVMNKQQADNIVNMFGYNSEIKKMNAYQALKVFQDDFISKQYYVLKEGMSELCNRMVIDIKKNKGILKNNNKVISISKDKQQRYKIKTNKDNIYISNKVIFCLKARQLLNFRILRPIHQYVKYIYNSQLLRIYAKYPIKKDQGVWFKNIRKTTTNSFIRQIIPINYETGLIMISYTDGVDVNVYKDNENKIKDNNEIKIQIQEELIRIFPEISIPQPTYFKAHYWEIGTHNWKKGCNPEEIYNNILNPIENIYICGEAFSLKQAWIEGGLETVNKIIKKN